jgi:hypothetical protein
MNNSSKSINEKVNLNGLFKNKKENIKIIKIFESSQIMGLK